MQKGRARSFPLFASSLLVLAAALAPADRASADDTPATAKSYFADRRWDGVTAADAGLAGAGLATDPHSSLYANPALALEGEGLFRVSGLLIQPHRDDLRASTTDYADASGFAALGEAGARWRMKGLGLSAYFAQPHYEHQETRFVGIDPGTGQITGDPFARSNEFTSATRYAGLGAATRLKNGLLLGLAAEGVFLEEKYSSIPDVPAGSGLADTLLVDRSATVFGGAAGAAYTVNGLVTLGASFHSAGSATYDDGGYDDAPQFTLVGVKVGRTAGSSAYAGARFLASRDVSLAETGGAPYHAAARSEYSFGYAYLDPAGVWSFRIGGGTSPRPEDNALKLSRFGIAIGAGSDGVRVGLAYAHTGESRDSGRSSSRDLFAATVEVTK